MEDPKGLWPYFKHMNKEIENEIISRIIDSMNRDPDAWKNPDAWSHFDSSPKYANNGIIVYLESGNITQNKIPLSLSWWNRRKILKAVKTLHLEKTLRSWDRAELNKAK